MHILSKTSFFFSLFVNSIKSRGTARPQEVSIYQLGLKNFKVCVFTQIYKQVLRYTDFAWILRRFCVDFARILRGFCVDFTRILRGFCADFAQILRGFCTDFAWILSGFCMDLARVLHRLPLLILEEQNQKKMYPRNQVTRLTNIWLYYGLYGL